MFQSKFNSIFDWDVEGWFLCKNNLLWILKNKTVYANYDNCCYKYRSENGVTISTEEEQFFSSHEEADNIMFFHLNHALVGSTVVMRTDDANSLVIALGYKHFFNTLEIWLGAGVQGKNNLRFINVNSI